MALKRRLSSTVDYNVDAQEKRQLYASNIEDCAYHSVFSDTLHPCSRQATPTSRAGAATPTSKASLYQPLASFQIRLLYIEPGRFEEPLVSTLSAADLLLEGGVVDPISRAYSTYEAVSYCWVDGSPTNRTMLCNNKTVALSQTQYDVFSHLRDKTSRRCLWLDAFCINQDNNQERAQQVEKMFTIFEHAEKVLIWLGLPSTKTAQVFEVLTKMRTKQLLERMHLSPFWPSYARSAVPFVPNMCLECHADMTLSIHEFADYPWFRRTWVRQEVFASKSATLLCGSLKFDWGDFVGYIRLLSEVTPTSSADSSVDQFAKQLRRLYSCRGSAHLDSTDCATGSLGFVNELFDIQVTQHESLDNADLFPILAISAAFDASDERDIVYGVLGMSNVRTSVHGGSALSLTVDYDRTVPQVYHDVAKYFVQREKSLDAVFLAQFFRDVTGRLASWCPYWPRMNCEPYKLRSLCHVKLLDSRHEFLKPARDGLTWPRVLSAESIELRDQQRLNKNPISFQDGSLSIEGHVLGVVQAQSSNDITTQDGPRLQFQVIDANSWEPISSSDRSGQSLTMSCNDYIPLHIAHVAMRLDSVINEIRNKSKKWVAEEINRLCLACVPKTTASGDLYCFLNASSAFVILRPIKYVGHDICQVRFVGIAFVTEKVFDISKLMPTNSSVLFGPSAATEETRKDLEAFNRVINQVSEGIGVPTEPVKKFRSSASQDSTPTPDVSFSYRRTGSTALSGRIPGNHDSLDEKRPQFQRHFIGPIISRRMTFEII